MLSLKNVSKRFGSIVALDDLSFEVAEGEFVFLTGPSGAGKTTVLKLLLRELLPDSGDIVLNNQNIVELSKKKVPALRKKIGVVFQDFKLLPERTVRENIEVALAVVGLPQNEWRDRVNHVLNLINLLDRSELFPNQLSGGEMQRVSLARALVVNPDIILADEPTGNLDWDTAKELMDLFVKVNEEGKTIMMATHHQILIDEMDKRVIELRKPTRAKKEQTEEIEAKKTEEESSESENDADEEVKHKKGKKHHE